MSDLDSITIGFTYINVSKRSKTKSKTSKMGDYG